ncbi:unnamed protein product [Heterosigma akashiwo]
MCAAVGNEKLGNKQERLTLALEVLAKMYETARAHFATDTTDHDYMIKTFSDMIGEAESAEAVRAWEFQVKVTDHGERHIKMSTGSTRRNAMPKALGAKDNLETADVPIYHGRDQALKGSELRQKLYDKKLKDGPSLGDEGTSSTNCSLS